MNKITWMLSIGLVLFMIALISMGPAQVVDVGNTVTIHYSVTLEDGTVYDSTKERGPLKVSLGKGILLSSFEAQLIGMGVGQYKKFTLPPEQAYGEYRPDLVGTLNRSQIEENVQFAIGKQVQTEFRDGTPTTAIITAFTDSTVTLDANHPLAGQALTFEVRLVAIDPAAVALPNPITSNWLWVALGATLIASTVIFLNAKKGYLLPVVKKSARPVYKPVPRRAQHR